MTDREMMMRSALQRQHDEKESRYRELLRIDMSSFESPVEDGRFAFVRTVQARCSLCDERAVAATSGRDMLFLCSRHADEHAERLRGMDTRSLIHTRNPVYDLLPTCQLRTAFDRFPCGAAADCIAVFMDESEWESRKPEGAVSICERHARMLPTARIARIGQDDALIEFRSTE